MGDKAVSQHARPFRNILIDKVGRLRRGLSHVNTTFKASECHVHRHRIVLRKGQEARTEYISKDLKC
jgi:hypothetical protein